MKTKIVIQTSQGEIELSLDEAKEMYDNLGLLFGEKFFPIVYPSYPTYPSYDINEWTVTCGDQ